MGELVAQRRGAVETDAVTIKEEWYGRKVESFGIRQ